MEADPDEKHLFAGENDHGGGGSGGGSKPKRKMKTPFQLEALEKVYAVETYPSEAVRAELSEKLDLSDRQLQMWFCHRRLKDKKESSAKKASKPVPGSPVEEVRMMKMEPGSDYRSVLGSGSSPLREPKKVGWNAMPVTRRSNESSMSGMEHRAILSVEAQLGESLREDGPILGMEFDPLPPGAFGMPVVPTTKQQKRPRSSYESEVYHVHDAKQSKASRKAVHEYQFLPEPSGIKSDAYGPISWSPFHNPPADSHRGRASPSVQGDETLPQFHGIHGQIPRFPFLSQQDRKENVFSSPREDDEFFSQQESIGNIRITAQSTRYSIVGPAHSKSFDVHADATIQIDREWKSDQARIVREAEAHEIQIHKELEKQDILRRKTEERMRKEMERYDRERRKEEERLTRERQRAEERLIREQRRELKRTEKILQKEYLRAEKRRQKEVLRREKEEMKRKAAIDKANARRVSKESLDLIDDEQLELMELAATSGVLPSVVFNLELSGASLRNFPPESVHLQKPFAIQPWVDSEANIGNLLMVWRFFVTFADVLGLWPFTLEEFVQALHDYDSRLLGELHIALLRVILKDIEDVARTVVTGSGTNQYSVANPEGGHPHIVEGGYVWGFDIRNWHCHLNPLTWPEILRQLALSAGLGPQLRKKNSTWTYLDNNDEVKGSEDAISTLRDGSAAENAFARMRERGLLLSRKSRHRLTPGTVKFAAFHVLSLEGSKGLTVFELAEKIQRSGLRDLTTSKTPEASISVALSRDQKLFERIAPSTYCVREPYRKDPADADAILAAARKKIQNFENGLLGGEIVDEVDRDDESDVDEEPEGDELSTPLSAPVEDSSMPKASPGVQYSVGTDASLTAKSNSENESLPFLPYALKDSKPTSVVEQSGALEDVGPTNVDQENVEIDVSKSGASWVLGLTEGEYSSLSVQERLDALVALVAVANEGNTIRAVLEDRLEAANALKKQMWALAQLDKSRFKDDIISKLDFPYFAGGKGENPAASCLMEPSQSPLLSFDGKKDAFPSSAYGRKPFVVSDNVRNNLFSGPFEKTLIAQDPSTNQDNFLTQQHGYTSKMLRSQLKAYIGHLAEETYIYRSLPLGQDRKRNRYWQFVTSASRNDPSWGRIFVELQDGSWRIIDSAEALDALLSSLDTRGVRESHLVSMLQKIKKSFQENGTTVKNEATGADLSSNCTLGVENPSIKVFGSNLGIADSFPLFRIELGRNEKEKMGALERYQDFRKWMWKECFNSFTVKAMKYGKKRVSQLFMTCDTCFSSYRPEDAADHSCLEKLTDGDFYVPVEVLLLKTLLACVEASIPQEVLESVWTESNRENWGMKLNRSSSTDELLQLLSVFESAIKQDHLSFNFETTKELLVSSSWQKSVSDSANVGSVPVLPWIPKTTAAVALRFYALDSSIIYTEHEKPERGEEKPIKVHMVMKLPSGQPRLVNKEIELKTARHDGSNVQENFIQQRRSRYSGHKRSARGSRNQVKGSTRSKKKPLGFKSGRTRQNTKLVDNLNEQLQQQGQKINILGSARGPRTLRKRRTETTADNNTLFGRMSTAIGPSNYSRSNRDFDEELIVDKDMMDVGDEGEPCEGHQNWVAPSQNGSSNGWNRNSFEPSEDDGDAQRYLEEEDVDMSDGSYQVDNNINSTSGSDLEESDDYSN